MTNTIAIIGVKGKMGMAIAKRLATGNHRLLFVKEERDQSAMVSNYLKETAPDAEIDVVECVRDSCWEADLIILDVPSSSEKMIAEKIREVATQKIVLRISDSEKNGDAPFSAAQQLQQLLPFSKVVAAFNNRTTPETYIAGDDEEAVQIISNMIRIAGYRSVVADSLSAIKTL